jgi:hypothetical protein
VQIQPNPLKIKHIDKIKDLTYDKKLQRLQSHYV